MSTRTADYDYNLPDDLIAQVPAAQRDQSRMLVVPRTHGDPTPTQFARIVNYVRPGDCLVLNDTKVIPARINGRKTTGGRAEALLLEPRDERCWTALLKPARRLQPGTVIHLENAASFTVMERRDDHFLIQFSEPATPAFLARHGAMPLPPYVARAAETADNERYQTVFATTPGAVAAPTAGLHFTDAILNQLTSKGVAIARLTLHVGIGTFRPVEVEDCRDHRMHDERYDLPPAAAATINAARAAGGRVIAVGTTAVRTLETCANPDGTVSPASGRTEIFIHPPKQPLATDALLTNFHLPKSTLMMLVAAFVGRERLLRAYELAIRERFRFYSYGDCMFIAPADRSSLDA